jgi:hypothetical protein
MLSIGVISLTSEQQDVVALSTIEAESVALSQAAMIAVRFHQLLRDIFHRMCGATTIDEDKDGAVKHANNPMASHTTTHIDIRHHYIRELVDARTIAVISIQTPDMLADGPTKCTFTTQVHHALRAVLRVLRLTRNGK